MDHAKRRGPDAFADAALRVGMRQSKHLMPVQHREWLEREMSTAAAPPAYVMANLLRLRQCSAGRNVHVPQGAAGETLALFKNIAADPEHLQPRMHVQDDGPHPLQGARRGERAAPLTLSV